MIWRSSCSSPTESGLRFRAVINIATGAAQQGLDLQGQLDNTVWFGQTVVGAPQITLDALIFGITGGQHHYWDLAGFAEPLQHVKTIQFWQQSTQQNNVHPLLQCGNQSLVALIALNDSVPSSG